MNLRNWLHLFLAAIAIAVGSLWLGGRSVSADDQPGASGQASYAPGAVCFAEDVVVAQPNVSIPDDAATGVCANFPAMGAGTVQSISLAIAADHTWVGDLKFSLVSPSGMTLTVLNQPGVVGLGLGNSMNLSATSPITFADGAPNDAENMGDGASSDIVCLTDGLCVYAPNRDGAGGLASFSGYISTASAGVWRLCAYDLSATDTGTLVQSRLTISRTYTCSAPTDTPTPSPTPTATSTPTAISTATATPTATSTPTVGPSSTPTSTQTPTVIASFTPTSTSTPTRTPTRTPTSTSAATATATAAPGFAYLPLILRDYPPCVVFGQDCLEPNDTLSIAKPLPGLNRAVFGTVVSKTASVDVRDMFTMSLQGNTRYTITLSGGMTPTAAFTPSGDLDLYLGLVISAVNVAQSVEYDQLAELIVYTPTLTDNYYVFIYAYAAPEIVPYRLEVRDVP